MLGINTASRTLYFGSGGFQEARGLHTGADFFLDNLKEELDQEGEWFVDAVQRRIYLWPNATTTHTNKGEDGFIYLSGSDSKETGGAPSASQPHPQRRAKPGLLVASQSDCILSVQGSSPTELVEGFSVHGLTFAHTSATYMQSPEVPSGGDWSVLRVGALQLERVRNASVVECTFRDLGGNALVVSDTAYNTSIVGNHFVWLGASAVLVLGRLDGMDGSAGPVTYPIGTVIHANLMHELGIWVKQSAGVGQALARASTIDGNICFNVPRACVNLNDGFGGAHAVKHNLLFNAVRETADHGPFNSWDRQPYISPKSDGTASLQQDVSTVHNNFIINKCVSRTQRQRHNAAS